MIGRGAYGAPWLPGALAADLGNGEGAGPPRGQALCDLVLEHVEAMLEHYGRALGLRNARKHIAWYLDPHRPPRSRPKGMAPAPVHG